MSSPSPATAAPRPLVAALLLAVVVLAWGVNWTVTKTIVATVPPLWTSAIRSAIAAAVLLALLLATRRLVVPCRGDLPVVAVVALFHMVGFSTLVAAGLTAAPVGRSIVLGYTTPLWVVPGAYLFLGEAVTARKIAGVALGLVGLALLFNPFVFDWGDDRALTGGALILGAAACWAVSIVYVRGHRWGATPFQLVFWQALLAATVLTGAAWAVDGIPAIEPTAELMLAFAYAGVVGTALAYWAMVTVNRALPAVTTSLGVLATPVVGIVAAALLLGEPVSAEVLAAVAFVTAGVALATVARPAPGAGGGGR